MVVGLWERRDEEGLRREEGSDAKRESVLEDCAVGFTETRVDYNKSSSSSSGGGQFPMWCCCSR